MPKIRVFVKGIRQVGNLSFKPYQMLKIGTVGLAAVKNRVQSGLNGSDQPGKPLSKGYAIRKSRLLRKKAVRDLNLTGAMFRNLQVRTVSANSAQARNTTRRDRMKGLANGKIEPWLVFSQGNQTSVMRAARLIFGQNVRNLVR